MPEGWQRSAVRARGAAAVTHVESARPSMRPQTEPSSGLSSAVMECVQRHTANPHTNVSLHCSVKSRADRTAALTDSIGEAQRQATARAVDYGVSCDSIPSGAQ